MNLSRKTRAGKESISSRDQFTMTSQARERAMEPWDVSRTRENILRVSRIRAANILHPSTFWLWLPLSVCFSAGFPRWRTSHVSVTIAHMTSDRPRIILNSGESYGFVSSRGQEFIPDRWTAFTYGRSIDSRSGGEGEDAWWVDDARPIARQARTEWRCDWSTPSSCAVRTF